MKRMFFLSNIYVDDKSVGITKKVLAQVKSFNDSGIEVKYLSGYINDAAVIYDSNFNIIAKRKFKFKSKFYKKCFKNKVLKQLCIDFIKKNYQNIDVAYMRYLYFDFKFMRLLKILKRKNIIRIVEAHTYPIKPKKFGLKKIVCIIDSMFTPFVKNNIDFVVAICDVKNIWGRQTINIDNAIGIDDIKPKKNKKLNRHEIHLLSVSTEFIYHGYDRVIKGLYEYYKNGNNKLVFKIKFVGTYLDSTISLVNKLGLNEYVEFTGRKKSDELDEYYEWADIGLGDLGRHRVGALSGSCLKTKEYFGKGLPFITSLVEPTYTSDYKYVLQLEANDNPIDFNKIEEFYNIVYSDADRVDNMVSFAKENFTWDKQLLPVVKEIEKRISLKSNESEK